MIGGFDTFPSWRHLDDLEHLERHVGAPFPFPIVAKCGEGERELEENAGKKEEEEKILGIGHDRAHVRISRLGGGRG